MIILIKTITSVLKVWTYIITIFFQKQKFHTVLGSLPKCIKTICLPLDTENIFLPSLDIHISVTELKYA
jgi:hypothetical protein